MQRIIKFRAWGGNGKKMLYDGIVLDMSDCSRHSTMLDFWGDSPTNIKIMQFTGLRDKQGKEIWEGDILRNRWRKFPSGVVFENGSFSIGYNLIVDDIETRESEVIGNIYEHPELLEEK